MGLVNCNTVGNLLNMVRSGRLNAKAMATHRFTFDQFEEATTCSPTLLSTTW